MFDIGFSELFILVVIALLVLGPERLPGAVRKAGLIIGKIKGSWQSIQNEINSEFEAEELRKGFKKKPTSHSRRSIQVLTQTPTIKRFWIRSVKYGKTLQSKPRFLTTTVLTVMALVKTIPPLTQGQPEPVNQRKA